MDAVLKWRRWIGLRLRTAQPANLLFPIEETPRPGFPTCLVKCFRRPAYSCQAALSAPGACSKRTSPTSAPEAAYILELYRRRVPAYLHAAEHAGHPPFYPGFKWWSELGGARSTRKPVLLSSTRTKASTHDAGRCRARSGFRFDFKGFYTPIAPMMKDIPA